MFANAYRRFRPYVHNTAWILGEKVLSLGLGFVATVLVARYLGPEGFGTLAYATSLVALFGISGHLGLHGLVVREIVKQPALRGETLGTTAVLKLLGVLVGYLLLLLYAAAYEGIGTVGFSLIAIAGAALLFTPIDVVDYWFNAFVQARYVSIARFSAQLVFVGFTVLSRISGLGSRHVRDTVPAEGDRCRNHPAAAVSGEGRYSTVSMAFRWQARAGPAEAGLGHLPGVVLRGHLPQDRPGHAALACGLGRSRRVRGRRPFVRGLVFHPDGARSLRFSQT